MSKNDDKIKQLLNKVDVEKKKLGPKIKVSYNTNCIFKYDDRRYFNLNTVTDTNVLVEALAFLLEKEAMYKEAAKRLDVDFNNLEWLGFSLNYWEEDFKLRAKVIKYNEQLDKLGKMQKQLNQLVSEEARTEMALEEIEKMF